MTRSAPLFLSVPGRVSLGFLHLPVVFLSGFPAPGSYSYPVRRPRPRVTNTRSGSTTFTSGSSVSGTIPIRWPGSSTATSPTSRFPPPPDCRSGTAYPRVESVEHRDSGSSGQTEGWLLPSTKKTHSKSGPKIILEAKQNSRPGELEGGCFLTNEDKRQRFGQKTSTGIPQTTRPIKSPAATGVR